MPRNSSGSERLKRMVVDKERFRYKMQITRIDLIDIQFFLTNTSFFSVIQPVFLAIQPAERNITDDVIFLMLMFNSEKRMRDVRNGSVTTQTGMESYDLSI